MEIPLLTPSEVAATLRIKTRAVYFLIRQRRLSAFRIGRRFRITAQDLEDFLIEQRHNMLPRRKIGLEGKVA